MSRDLRVHCPTRSWPGLNILIGKEDSSIIIPVQRWFVEDGREILNEAMTKNIVLLTYGDPLIATTLTELYVRAVKSSIKVNIIHARFWSYLADR